MGYATDYDALVFNMTFSDEMLSFSSLPMPAETLFCLVFMILDVNVYKFP